MWIGEGVSCWMENQWSHCAWDMLFCFTYTSTRSLRTAAPCRTGSFSSTIFNVLAENGSHPGKSFFHLPIVWRNGFWNTYQASTVGSRGAMNAHACHPWKMPIKVGCDKNPQKPQIYFGTQFEIILSYYNSVKILTFYHILHITSGHLGKCETTVIYVFENCYNILFSSSDSGQWTWCTTSKQHWKRIYLKNGYLLSCSRSSCCL